MRGISVCSWLFWDVLCLLETNKKIGLPKQILYFGLLFTLKLSRDQDTIIYRCTKISYPTFLVAILNID